MTNDTEDSNLAKNSLCTRDIFPFFSTTDSAVLDLHCQMLSFLRAGRSGLEPMTSCLLYRAGALPTELTAYAGFIHSRSRLRPVCILNL